MNKVSDKSDQLAVTWDAPAPPGPLCPITSYKVTWRSDDGKEDNHITGGSDTSYIITGLVPCTSYIVSVAAATSKGFGDASDEATGNTLTAGKLNQTALL